MMLDCHIPLPLPDALTVVRRDAGVMLRNEERMCRLEQVSAFSIHESGHSDAGTCFSKCYELHSFRIQFHHSVISMYTLCEIIAFSVLGSTKPLV
jgi:hypothetical protein